MIQLPLSLQQLQSLPPIKQRAILIIRRRKVAGLLKSLTAKERGQVDAATIGERFNEHHFTQVLIKRKEQLCL